MQVDIQKLGKDLTAKMGSLKGNQLLAIMAVIDRISKLPQDDLDGMRTLNLGQFGVTLEDYYIGLPEDGKIPQGEAGKSAHPIIQGKPGLKGDQAEAESPGQQKVGGSDQFMAEENGEIDYEIGAWERRLRERIDLEALETAIREAEALDIALAAILKTPLKEARNFYDKARENYEQITTMGRSEDLYESWLGYQKLKEEKRSRIPDAIMGDQLVDIGPLKDEFEKNWQHNSKKIIDDFSTYRNKYKNKRPDLVADHLERVKKVKVKEEFDKHLVKIVDIADILHPNYVEEWTKIDKEITKDFDDFTFANDEIKKGDESFNLHAYWEAYEHYYNSKQSFLRLNIDPKIKISQSKLNDTQADAQVDLIQKFSQRMAEAEKARDSIMDQGKNFMEAVKYLNEGKVFIDKWQRQAEITLEQQLMEAENVKHSIAEQEKAFRRIDNQISSINKALQSIAKNLREDDKSSRQKLDEITKRIQKLEQELKSNRPLNNFFTDDILKLWEEVAAREGVHAAVEKAIALKQDENLPPNKKWLGIINLLKKYASEESAKNLFNEAKQEDCIYQIGEIIHAEMVDIPRASKLINELPKDIQNSRLSDEKEVITTAKSHDPKFQQYFYYARNIREDPSVSKRCEAYAIFTHLCGLIISVEKLPPGIPPYALNSFSYESWEFKEKIKTDLHKEIDNIYHIFIDQNELFAPRQTVEIWAEQVKAMREVGLILETNRPAACWVEAGLALATGAGSAAWEDLARFYPNSLAIKEGVKKANAAEVIQLAGEINNPGERIIYLQDEQISKHLVGNIDILICLAGAYEAQDDFLGALDCLDIKVEALPINDKNKVKDEIERIKHEEIIHKRLIRAEALTGKAYEQGIDTQRMWRDALSMLLEAPESISMDHRIQERAKEFFDQAKDGLEENIKTHLSSNDEMGQLLGVLGLIDLDLLDKIGSRDLNQRAVNIFSDPEQELKRLIQDNQYANVLEEPFIELVNRVDPREHSFGWDETPADQLCAIVKDVSLKNERLLQYAPENLSLKATKGQLDKVVLELNKLLLRTDRYLHQNAWQDDISNPLSISSKTWKNAVQNDDFSWLERIEKNILDQLIDGKRGVLGGILEGKRFKEILKESKAITKNLVDVQLGIRNFHAREEFQGVCDIIEWGLEPFELEQQKFYPWGYPWEKPLQEEERYKFDQINWDAIPPDPSNRLKNLIFSTTLNRGNEQDRNGYYRMIWNWLNEKIAVSYVLDGKRNDIRGWVAIKLDAAARQGNFTSWKEAQKDAQEVGNKAWLAYQLVKVWYDEELPWGLKDDYEWAKMYESAKASGALFPNAERWINEAVTGKTSKIKVRNLVENENYFEAELTKNNKMPLAYQRWMWGNAKFNLSAYLRVETIFPEEALSNKAKNIKVQLGAISVPCHLAFEDADGFLKKWENWIEFPCEADLSNAIKTKNKPVFNRLMAQAQSVGPEDPKDASIYWTFKKNLETKSFLDRLFFFITGSR